MPPIPFTSQPPQNGQSDSGPIANNKYDLLYVAIHEQIHGLGMVSFWTNVGSGLFAPNGHGIYDSFLTTNTSAMDLCSNSDAQDPCHAALLTDATQRNGVSFVSQYSNLVLFTPSVFATSSSLVHVDETLYANTQEFLMGAHAPVGMSLRDACSNGGGSHGPFGIGLLGVLKTLGYTLDSNINFGTPQY